MRTAALLTLFALTTPVRAGLYYSGEELRPLPARWSGYLPDHRLLRTVGMTDPRGLIPTPPLRDAYADSALKLEAAAKSGPLTADQAADLGALNLRLGRFDKALGVLQPAVRRHPEHFRLAANLGTAWQVNGDLPQAVTALEEAVRLAPAELRSTEALHLKLVRGRAADPKATGLDALFDFDKLPPDCAGFDAATGVDPAERRPAALATWRTRARQRRHPHRRRDPRRLHRRVRPGRPPRPPAPRAVSRRSRAPGERRDARHPRHDRVPLPPLWPARLTRPGSPNCGPTASTRSSGPPSPRPSTAPTPSRTS